MFFLFGLLILLFSVVLFYFSSKQDENKVSPLVQTEKKATQPLDKTIVAIEKPVVIKQNDDDKKLLKEPPKTSVLPKLELSLHQVIFDEEKKSGYAMISYQGEPQKIYVIGGRLSEGVTLARLFKDGVVIDNHGTLEKYYANKPTTAKPSKKISKSTLSAEEQQERVRADLPPSFTPGEAPPSDSKLSPSLSPTIPDDKSPPPPSDGPVPNE